MYSYFLSTQTATQLSRDQTAKREIMSKRTLTNEEKEFIALLKPGLPPIIARREVERFLGGVVTGKTLKNADSAGDGPVAAYRIGRGVAYETNSLLEWVVLRLGVVRLAHIKNL